MSAVQSHAQTQPPPGQAGFTFDPQGNEAKLHQRQLEQRKLEQMRTMQQQHNFGALYPPGPSSQPFLQQQQQQQHPQQMAHAIGPSSVVGHPQNFVTNPSQQMLSYPRAPDHDQVLPQRFALGQPGGQPSMQLIMAQHQQDQQQRTQMMAQLARHGPSQQPPLGGPSAGPPPPHLPYGMHLSSQPLPGALAGSMVPSHPQGGVPQQFRQPGTIGVAGLAGTQRIPSDLAGLNFGRDQMGAGASRVPGLPVTQAQQHAMLSGPPGSVSAGVAGMGGVPRGPPAPGHPMTVNSQQQQQQHGLGMNPSHPISGMFGAHSGQNPMPLPQSMIHPSQRTPFQPHLPLTSGSHNIPHVASPAARNSPHPLPSRSRAQTPNNIASTPVQATTTPGRSQGPPTPGNQPFYSAPSQPNAGLGMSQPGPPNPQQPPQNRSQPATPVNTHFFPGLPSDSIPLPQQQPPSSQLPGRHPQQSQPTQPRPPSTNGVMPGGMGSAPEGFHLTPAEQLQRMHHSNPFSDQPQQSQSPSARTPSTQPHPQQPRPPSSAHNPSPQLRPQSVHGLPSQQQGGPARIAARPPQSMQQSQSQPYPMPQMGGLPRSMSQPAPPNPGNPGMPAPGIPNGPNVQARPTPGQLKLAAYNFLGNGQGVLRMLEFSLAMSNGNEKDLEYWKSVAKDFFVADKGVLRMTLWNGSLEAKPFDITEPRLPRFYFSSFCAGVTSIHLTLNGARESSHAPGEALIECTAATWTYTFANGYVITLMGPLRAHVVVVPQPPTLHGPQLHSLKFSYVEFSSSRFTKTFNIDAIEGTRSLGPISPSGSPHAPNTSGPQASPNGMQPKKNEEYHVLIDRAVLPPEPVNAFGIPQATMRCLELAESVGQMDDLIRISFEHQLGPLASLAKFASIHRDPSASEARTELVTNGSLQAASLADPQNIHPPDFQQKPFPTVGNTVPQSPVGGQRTMSAPMQMQSMTMMNPAALESLATGHGHHMDVSSMTPTTMNTGFALPPAPPPGLASAATAAAKRKQPGSDYDHASPGSADPPARRLRTNTYDGTSPAAMASAPTDPSLRTLPPRRK